MGKSALVRYAVDSAPDMHVETVVGVESEIEFPFAAVHKLLARHLNRMDGLAAPRRDALAAALGLVSGESPNRLLVGLAVLDLLSSLAEEQPLLCVVDDSDCLDQASGQTLAFVARRLEAEPIVLLFAVGESERKYLPLEGLPELRLSGISDAAARELLSRGVRGRLDRHVRDRLVAEMDGNPLALRELPGSLTPAQLAGSAVLPEPLPLGERLEASFLQLVRRLPAETQSLLLLVAAEQGGNADLLWRAAGKLGLDAAALAPAERANLVSPGPPVTFRHSFVRSAIYTAAPVGDRRRAHRALAQALDGKVDPDRKAWHRAAAAVAPSEALAQELERSAGVARTRGGYAAAGALLQRAAELTPDRNGRVERSLEAAQSQLTAGAVETASALVAEVLSGIGDPLQRVRAQKLTGAIALARGNALDAPQILLEAARAFASLDARLARDAHLEALAATLYAGPLARAGAALDAAQAAKDAPPPPGAEPTAADFLLDGYASLLTDGNAPAEPALRAGIEALIRRGDLRWFGLGFAAAFDIWDDEALLALATRHVQLARDTGALTGLPNALSQLGGYEVLAGRFRAAEAAFDESREVAVTSGNPGILGRTDVGELIVAAWRGRARTRALARACARDGRARGVGVFASFADYALAVLELGLRNYEAALTAARQASADALVATRTLPELIEAAVRSGEGEVAASATERLAETVLPSGTEWGLGMLARSRALVAKDGEAEALYQEAIEHLQRCRVTPQLARARLIYGEWLRRARRRRKSREQLRTAHQMLVSMGAHAFAERAEAELVATGEHLLRPRASGAALTPHELRIARLVSEGGTNRDVAAQLFISPRTVEYHLHKIFKKLGLTSRTELTATLLESMRSE